MADSKIITRLWDCNSPLRSRLKTATVCPSPSGPEKLTTTMTTSSADAKHVPSLVISSSGTSSKIRSSSDSSSSSSSSSSRSSSEASSPSGAAEVAACPTPSPSSPESSYASPLPSSPKKASKWLLQAPWSTAALVLALAVVPRCLAAWQLASIAAASLLLFLSGQAELVLRIRRVLKPIVLKKVVSGTRTVEAIQRLRTPLMDRVMCLLAQTVSSEFYTAFLPILFWSGREDLGILLAMLMALCIYMGNGFKDLVCAPRPFSPPVVRVTGSAQEVHNSREYGIPSTHTINIVSLSLYLLHWLKTRSETGSEPGLGVAAFFFLLTVSVVFGRLYLGMHSPIDLAVGLAMGLLVTATWSSVDLLVLQFLQHGHNVLLFSLAVTILCVVAYPEPEEATPSFEDHTLFVGCIFGLCAAFSIHPTSASTFLPLTPSSIVPVLLRCAIGLPLAVAVKAAGKEVARAVWPPVLSALGIPIYSKKYVKHLLIPGAAAHEEAVPTALAGHGDSHTASVGKSIGSEGTQAQPFNRDSFDVDTVIRFTQGAALGLCVKGIAPLAYGVVGL